MGPLSDIFSSDDNSSDQSSMTQGDLGNVLDINADSSNESYSQDEDGNMSYNSSDNSLGINNDTDSLLHNVTDSMTSSDDSEVGGS